MEGWQSPVRPRIYSTCDHNVEYEIKCPHSHQYVKIKMQGVNYFNEASAMVQQNEDKIQQNEDKMQTLESKVSASPLRLKSRHHQAGLGH